MRALIIITIPIICFIIGCGETEIVVPRSENLGKELLTVDFQEDQILRYKFTSGRNIIIEWAPSDATSTTSSSSIIESSESMEMVMAYKPLEIELYGLTTIQATCESVQVKRSQGSQADAISHFAGQTYTFKVGPTGKIEDYSELDKIIKEIGEKAFQPETDQGRIKEPDMIGDIVASQWFLWDSVSSIGQTFEGILPGQSWNSKLSVPTPMVLRQARDVTYRFEDTRQSEAGRLAVITSTFSKADSTPASWPVPYTGTFQMRGRFGFLGNYKVLDLQGSGEELFNINLGRTENYIQQYTTVMESSIPLGIGENPRITIDQKITMEILEN